MQVRHGCCNEEEDVIEIKNGERVSPQTVTPSSGPAEGCSALGGNYVQESNREVIALELLGDRVTACDM
jgi:hypothetical protein